MKTNNTAKINKLIEKLDNADNARDIMLKRQLRLKTLVDKWGIDDVALAAGFAVSTLNQYLRVKHPITIREDSVARAEFIFQQL